MLSRKGKLTQDPQRPSLRLRLKIKNSNSKNNNDNDNNDNDNNGFSFCQQIDSPSFRLQLVQILPGALNGLFHLLSHACKLCGVLTVCVHLVSVLKLAGQKEKT